MKQIDPIWTTIKHKMDTNLTLHPSTNQNSTFSLHYEVLSLFDSKNYLHEVFLYQILHSLIKEIDGNKYDM